MRRDVEVLEGQTYNAALVYYAADVRYLQSREFIHCDAECVDEGLAVGFYFEADVHFGTLSRAGVTIWMRPPLETEHVSSCWQLPKRSKPGRSDIIRGMFIYYEGVIMAYGSQCG